MHIPFNPIMLIPALGLGLISAYLASRRGKNPYLWFAVGFLFGIIGIFAIFFASLPRKKAPLAPQPNFQLIGPHDKFWYYLDPAHTQQGPMSKEAMVNAWKSGKIHLATLIWHEELTDWKPLKEVSEGQH